MDYRQGELPGGLSNRLARMAWKRDDILKYRMLNYWLAFMSSGAGSVINVRNNVEVSDRTLQYLREMDIPRTIRLVSGKEDVYGTGTVSATFDQKMVMGRCSFEYLAGNRWDSLLRGRGDIVNMEAEARALVSEMTRDFNMTVAPQLITDQIQSNAGIFDTDIAQVSSMNHLTYTAGNFGFEQLFDLQRIASTGRNFPNDPNKQIRPITGIRGFSEDSFVEPNYYFFCDDDLYNEIRKSSGYQNASLVDTRGHTNLVFKALIQMEVANVQIVKMPSYIGVAPNLPQGSFGTNTPFVIDKTEEIEVSGFRQYDTVNQVWTGHPNFDFANTRISRGVLVGKDALLLDRGREPFSKIELGNYEQTGSAATFIDMAMKKSVWSLITRDTLAMQSTDRDNFITVDVEINP